MLWSRSKRFDSNDQEQIRSRLIKIIGSTPAFSTQGDRLTSAETTQSQKRVTSDSAPEWLIEPTAPPHSTPETSGSQMVQTDQANNPLKPTTPVARAVKLRFNPGRRGLVVIAAVGLVATVVTLLVAWRFRPVVEPFAQATKPHPSHLQPSASSEVVVAVAGEVTKPGLVRLPSGARVADAIEAAGGLKPDSQTGSLNLARRAVDGELIVVGDHSTPSNVNLANASSEQNTTLVDLNTATLVELDALPGVGTVLAQHILDYRLAHGRFNNVNELRRVDGIGDTRFQRLKPLVTV